LRPGRFNRHWGADLRVGLDELVDRLRDDLRIAVAHVLLGGRFGEMSTLMNWTYQSFNFRGRDKVKPFYDLIANIATEEYGHRC
jgi:hypothetical protein